MTYTVVLQYPEYMAENFGEDNYCTSVEADNPTEAVRAARQEVKDDYPDELRSQDDMFLVVMFEGDHKDLAPQVEWERLNSNE